MSIKPSNIFGSINTPSNVPSKSISDLNTKIGNLMHIDKSMLKTITLSSTSNGMLCKFSRYINGDNYYFKTGNLDSAGFFSNLEPISEVMCYRLGKQLGFKNVIETFYTYIDFPETDDYSEQRSMVSFTKDFLLENESLSTFHEILAKEINNKDGNTLYDFILDSFKSVETEIIEMLLFDFISLNSDRHLNNIGIISNQFNYKLCPIFDNGLSMLSELSDVIIDMPVFNLDKSLKCKPFMSKPYNQIKLLDLSKISEDLRLSILNCNLNWEDIFYDMPLSDLRKLKITKVVERRLSHVKDLLLKEL